MNHTAAFSINALHTLEAAQYHWWQQENLPSFSSSAVSSVCLIHLPPEEKKCYVSGMSPVIIFYRKSNASNILVMAALMLEVYIFKRENIYRHNLDILTVRGLSDLILRSLVAKALSHWYLSATRTDLLSIALISSIINPAKFEEEKQGL